MAMGNTGTINVSREMLNNAQQAIKDYRDTTTKLYEDIKAVVQLTALIIFLQTKLIHLLVIILRNFLIHWTKSVLVY